MKILWVCGVPSQVAEYAASSGCTISSNHCWPWILGHLPPPDNIEMHFLCPVFGLNREMFEFDYLGAHWHCFRRRRFEPLFFWRRFCLKTKKFVQRISPDVIHGWGGELGFGYLASLYSNCAVVSVQGLLRLLSVHDI